MVHEIGVVVGVELPIEAGGLVGTVLGVGLGSSSAVAAMTSVSAMAMDPMITVPTVAAATVVVMAAIVVVVWILVG